MAVVSDYSLSVLRAHFFTYSCFVLLLEFKWWWWWWWLVMNLKNKKPSCR